MDGLILYGRDFMQKAGAALGHLGVTLYCICHAVLTWFCFVLCVDGEGGDKCTQA